MQSPIFDKRSIKRATRSLHFEFANGTNSPCLSFSCESISSPYHQHILLHLSLFTFALRNSYHQLHSSNAIIILLQKSSPFTASVTRATQRPIFCCLALSLVSMQSYSLVFILEALKTPNHHCIQLLSLFYNLTYDHQSTVIIWHSSYVQVLNTELLSFHFVSLITL